jgi:hypothetical protein
MIFDVYEISELFDVPLGAPLPGFIYATGLEFTSVLVEYGLESSFFVFKSIFESLYLSTSLMGRTRYTNLWVPEGHTLVTHSHQNDWCEAKLWWCDDIFK